MGIALALVDRLYAFQVAARRNDSEMVALIVNNFRSSDIQAFPIAAADPSSNFAHIEPEALEIIPNGWVSRLVKKACGRHPTLPTNVKLTKFSSITLSNPSEVVAAFQLK